MATMDKEPQSVALDRVTMTHRLAEAVDHNRIDSIRLARDTGASWEQIGRALGMTRQAAHKRYASLVGEVDGTAAE